MMDRSSPRHRSGSCKARPPVTFTRVHRRQVVIGRRSIIIRVFGLEFVDGSLQKRFAFTGSSLCGRVVSARPFDRPPSGFKSGRHIAGENERSGADHRSHLGIAGGRACSQVGELRRYEVWRVPSQKLGCVASVVERSVTPGGGNPREVPDRELYAFLQCPHE